MKMIKKILHSIDIQFILYGCLIWFVGCASFKTISPGYIDDEFLDYYEYYQDLKLKYINKDIRPNISIYFKSLERPSVGRCVVYYSGDRYIEIDPKHWYNSTKTERWIIFLHEMGHCDLNRGHDDPETVMQSYVVDLLKFTDNEEYFVEELFGVTEKVPSFFKVDDSDKFMYIVDKGIVFLDE